MHLLVTADTVGGVWTYTEELVSGLALRGHQITLISFGKLPSPDQTLWMSGLRGLDYRPTEFRLEWMQDAELDIVESMQYLCSVAREVKPDLLHVSQFAYGALPIDIPRVVVAHSDVLSWWSSVRGEDPPQTEWFTWYRHIVAAGLSGATAVVTPSKSMLDSLQQNFETPCEATVIPNGRDSRLFDPDLPKVDRVVAVGRLWDQAKNISVLTRQRHPIPVLVAGAHIMNSDSKELTAPHPPPDCNVDFAGVLSQPELRHVLAMSSIYAATSCYEPFGLAPLEAALSGCALIANDIPTFHELWGDAALYFRHNDAASLAGSIALLASNPDIRQDYADRAYRRALEQFTTDRMFDGYEALYQRIACVGDCV
jgi:glycogen synthase